MGTTMLHTTIRPGGRRRTAVVAATLLALAGLTACSTAQGATPAGSEPAASGSAAATPRTSFKIGVGADNPTEAGVVEYISKTLAPEHGISVELVELEDSRHLNEAVDAGELDGHVALHEPYLKSVLAEQPQWELGASVPVYISILTVASRKHASLDDIP
ncbi:MAG: MetQ/NlpA family ABC transporter substrate-binding protein, partial [Propionicimonas sp.]